MTLVEFLLARIADDEEGEHDYWCSWSQSPSGSCDCPRRRALADCEAKRRIVQQVTNAEMVAAQHDSTAQDCAINDAMYGTLQLLALPHADHPDYRQEWKP